MVDHRRRANQYEDDIYRDCRRYFVDKRIIDYLANEYERSKEEPEYKMKTVPEIKELIRQVDSGELD